jgi:8-oxo-dGTP diphosphatase
MYITQEVLNKIERKYGVPDILHTRYTMNRAEFDLLEWSMRNGRRHDVTLFISNEEKDKIVVIRKPSYPKGVYRPPSGGIEPGEDFEIGARREAYEETGLEIKLQKYALRSHVDLAFEDEIVAWASHVLAARVIGGRLEPVDKKEIAGVRWATINELRTDLLVRLQQSDSSGLQYRAELQDATLKQYGGKVI